MGTNGFQQGPTPSDGEVSRHPEAWFAGTMPRSNCEKLVCSEEHGAFLVRQSSNGRNYVICVNDNGSPMHFRIDTVDHGFVFAENVYKSLESIISFLKSQILHGKSGMLLQLTLPAQGGFRFHDTEKPQKQLSQPSRVTEPIPAPRRRQTAPTIELPPPPIHVTEEKRRSASQDFLQNPPSPLSPTSPTINILEDREISFREEDVTSPTEHPVSSLLGTSSRNTSRRGSIDSGDLMHDGDDMEPEDDEKFDTVDMFYEALQKKPIERTPHDTTLMVSEMKQFRCFVSSSDTFLRHLCSNLEYFEYKKGDLLCEHTESKRFFWFVLTGQISATVRSTEEESTSDEYVISEGGTFGHATKEENMNQEGLVYIAGPSGCQIVRASKEDYEKAESEATLDTQQFFDEDACVLVTQQQQLESGPVAGIVHGAPDFLVRALVYPNEYNVEDDKEYLSVFLLCYRTFLSPTEFGEMLVLMCTYAEDAAKVLSIASAWVTHHASDFVEEPKLVYCLHRIEVLATKAGAAMQLIHKLQVCRESVTTCRSVQLRKTKHGAGINLKAGRENGLGTFVSAVMPDSIAEQSGVVPGDQILSINGQDVTLTKHETAVQAIQKFDDLHLTLQFNPSLVTILTTTSTTSATLTIPGSPDRERLPSDVMENEDIGRRRSVSSKLRGIFTRKASESKSLIFRVQDKYDAELHQVIRVMRSDGVFRYVVVLEDTTAVEVVRLLCDMWQITEKKLQLSMVNFKDGKLVQKLVPDGQADLSRHQNPGARYFLVEDDEIVNVPKGLDWDLSCTVNNFHQDVFPRDVSRFLAMTNRRLFKAIKPVEYVTYLWREEEDKINVESIQSLVNFFNRMQKWVMWEILRQESSLKVRAEVLRRFIKVAMACKEAADFNAFFAIVGGLSATPISRLKLTWSKLPKKYQDSFTDLQNLMDPSRNMAKYRQYLSAEIAKKQTYVPSLPILLKDITMINIGNKNLKDGLVNFEKLRMLTREINRHQVELDNYNPATMFPKKDPKPTTPKAGWQKLNALRSISVYFNNAPIVSDELELYEMSYTCEARPGSRPPSPKLTRRKSEAGALRQRSKTTSEASSDRPLTRRASFSTTRRLNKRHVSDGDKPNEDDDQLAEKKNAPSSNRLSLVSEESDTKSHPSGPKKTLEPVHQEQADTDV
eukprot:m.140887 g.140887  ORF g.140887 m.140887 type:complete len:1165 (+) comp14835_c0_seq1:273-3767(+)